jgi:hypothetical protein
VRNEQWAEVWYTYNTTGIISIFPCEQTFIMSGSGIKTVVKRCQLPITPAFTYTDYQSQGQILKYIIIDIAKPPVRRQPLDMWSICTQRERSHDASFAFATHAKAKGFVWPASHNSSELLGQLVKCKHRKQERCTTAQNTKTCKHW